jgi:hypothetical protein
VNQLLGGRIPGLTARFVTTTRNVAGGVARAPFDPIWIKPAFIALDQQSLQISAPHTLTFNEYFMQKKKRMVRRAEVTIQVRYCSTPREVGRLEDL